MRRRSRLGRALRLLLGALIALVALALVNAYVLGSETRPAEVNAPGGEILRLEDSFDLQVVDEPPSAGGPRAAARPPFVLLHGFATSSRWWDPIAPELRRDRRVIRIDLIGHGGSEKPQSGYEITTQAGAVADALNELDVQRAILVSHSMGGLVATSLAQTSSELVDSVVLIATPSGSDSGGLPVVDRLLHVPVLGPALWRIRLDGMIRDGYGSAFAPGTDVSAIFPGDPDRVVEDNRAMTYTAYDSAEERTADFLEQEPPAARLISSGVPVLAIEGGEDQITDPVRAAADFGTIPGARVVTLPGSGHSPQVEEPGRTAQVILRFAGGR